MSAGLEKYLQPEQLGWFAFQIYRLLSREFSIATHQDILPCEDTPLKSVKDKPQHFGGKCCCSDLLDNN